MRVIVTLDDGQETRIEGDASIFGKGFDSRLRDIGFWVDNWRYAGQSGPNHKNRVFIPWTSALMVEDLK